MKSKMLESGGAGLCPALALFAIAAAAPLHADVIRFGGTIDQSVQDGTGPAINNPALNDILDGAEFTVDIGFQGSIAAPGTYQLMSAIFHVASAGFAESDFDSASLTVVPFAAGLDELSVFACLSSGSGCNQGNELAINLLVPATQLNSADALAFADSPLLPFDLLEDDGATDIHGSITQYSYTPPAGTPEPTTLCEFGTALAAVVFVRLRRRTVRR